LTAAAAAVAASAIAPSSICTPIPIIVALFSPR
jgi:hypothetical protein